MASFSTRSSAGLGNLVLEPEFDKKEVLFWLLGSCFAMLRGRDVNPRLLGWTRAPSAEAASARPCGLVPRPAPTPPCCRGRLLT
jgi:hypothetical protein